jgi:hypothetical protein
MSSNNELRMRKPKVPSLQHLVRHWQKSPDAIRRSLVNLVRKAPNFSYQRVYSAVVDMLIFKQPLDQILEGVRRGVKQDEVRNNFLELLPLICDHFRDLAPAFVLKVSPRFYSIGRGLMVPFEPPLVYGIGGQLYFPWFSFWRQNPINSEQLSLFVTVVREILAQDPDMDTSKFEILDFAAPGSGKPRELRIIDAHEVPLVTDRRKTEMLEIFAEGFLLAEAELRGEKGKRREESAPPKSSDKDQLGLFSWDNGD